MPLDLDDTIAAIASTPGGAARGIIRLSGQDCREVLRSLFVSSVGRELPADGPATIHDGMIRLPEPLGEIPVRLYFWPTTRSYTRQPLAELHTLGSPPLLEAMLAALCQAGARLAQPGEFTLRAFLAGRLDLTQAEGVLGVIDARGQRELDAALSQLSGGLALPLAELRSGLLDLLAHLEAGLDFADEDIEFIAPDELERQLGQHSEKTAAIAAQMASRHESSARPRVVLVGEPNAGKSSLLNALAGSDAAIVSPQAGTTRDYVTARLVLDGQECLLVDTAGIECLSMVPITAAAQEQTSTQASQADLTLLCVDVSRAPTAWEISQLENVPQSPRLVVFTKHDLVSANQKTSPGNSTSLAGALDFCVSSVSGDGLAALRQAIFAALAQASSEMAVVASTAARSRESLSRAAAALSRAREAATTHLGEELVAAEIRGALDDLGQVVGAVYTDDVLDRIFSRFCIGK